LRRAELALSTHNTGLTHTRISLAQQIDLGADTATANVQMPSTNATAIYYKWTPDADTSVSANIDCCGYVLPNGAS
jgi:hypothetical protein